MTQNKSKGEPKGESKGVCKRAMGIATTGAGRKKVVPPNSRRHSVWLTDYEFQQVKALVLSIRDQQA